MSSSFWRHLLRRPTIPCSPTDTPPTEDRGQRGRLLRLSLILGLSATLLGGLPVWDPNPNRTVQVVQRGIPFGWIRTSEPTGLPFPIVHPHGSKMPALGIQLPVNTMQEWVFDLLNLARNWLVLAALVYGAEVAWCFLTDDQRMARWCQISRYEM